MGTKEAYYIKCLNGVLSERKERNQSYSLRSFAKSLEVDATYLSRILGRKQIPSLELADEILLKINNPEIDRNRFLISVQDEAKCMSLNKFDHTLTNCEDEK